MYVSKEEKKIPIYDPSGRWTDLTLLPEWEEEYYNVYTARKHGKWVMLKALKPNYATDPRKSVMIEKEFDTRYNLAHPNIVMVNDFEIIPGLGQAIVTDDVYGYSLRRLIEEKRLTPRIVQRLQTQLIDAMTYIQENHIIHHPITPENIIFTEDHENLKLINVGYDQSDSLSPQDTAVDLKAWGTLMTEVLGNIPAKLPNLERIARRAKDGKFSSVDELHLALERRSSAQIYIFICAFIAIMVFLIIWLTAFTEYSPQ